MTAVILQNNRAQLSKIRYGQLYMGSRPSTDKPHQALMRRALGRLVGARLIYGSIRFGHVPP